MTRARIYRDLRAAFWHFVDQGEGCWLWQGSTTKGGYGRIKHKGLIHRAHRLSWQLQRGPIPDGLFVCHKCDVPLCVNPDHLFLGTAAENARDRDRKGRNSHGPGHFSKTQPERVLRGERHGMAKLTVEQVREIRRLLAAYTCVDIAKQFGVNYTTISRIKRGQGWKAVKEEL